MNREAGVIKRIDRYLRREDTVLGRAVISVNRDKGPEYLNGKTKRALDLGVAVPLAVVATPVVLGLGVAKRLEDGGSAFFVQKRVAQEIGKTIGVIKIRCMKPGSDKGRENISTAEGLTPEADPRNTRLGAFMRRYQLEELPQVWQVIQGKLSVLGLRPNTQYGFDYLQQVWDEDKFRSWVKAYHGAPLGVSGLYQALGSNVKADEKRYRMDRFYIEHGSLGLDLYLVWKTVTRLVGVK